MTTAIADRDRRVLGLSGTDIRLESFGIITFMKAVVDSVGRIVIPKQLRDTVGLTAGSLVDISRYGAGLQIIPAGRTARLVEEDGVLVASGRTRIDDDVVFGLVDAFCR